MIDRHPYLKRANDIVTASKSGDPVARQRAEVRRCREAALIARRQHVLCGYLDALTGTGKGMEANFADLNSAQQRQWTTRLAEVGLDPQRLESE